MVYINFTHAKALAGPVALHVNLYRMQPVRFNVMHQRDTRAWMHSQSLDTLF